MIAIRMIFVILFFVVKNEIGLSQDLAQYAIQECKKNEEYYFDFVETLGMTMGLNITKNMVKKTTLDKAKCLSYVKCFCDYRFFFTDHTDVNIVFSLTAQNNRWYIDLINTYNKK